MNNGKYHTESYRLKQNQKLDRQFGPIEDHKKLCKICKTDFIFKGRIRTKEYERALFCSRSCANTRTKWWNVNATHYRTIALRHHAEKCVICGFNKIVAIHHIDENKKNNSPDNLIPLCPNHHEMYHSNKWKNEIKPYIDEWQDSFRKSYK